MTPWNWLPAWQQTDVEIKADNSVYRGFYHVREFELRHRCFSGQWSAWLKREQIRRADAAAVLLWDPEQDKIIMIEQFRMGLMGVYADQSPWLLEIVAGLLDSGEDPAQTVRREALEEAGYEISTLHPLGQFYNTPGGFSEKTHLFCGIVTAREKGEIHGLAHDHEDILTHVLDAGVVINALETGKLVTSASTVIALGWLKEKRSKKL
jgi:ADP-ribose pyrophosphatase